MSSVVYGSAVVMVSVAIGWNSPVIATVVDIVIVLLIVLFFVVVRPPFYARIWRYEILDDELYLQSGLVTQRRQSIPLMRVQNVDTWQGPIGRLFKVSAVHVSTAGGMLEIPMLDELVAAELRERIDAHVRALRPGAAEGSDAG